ncbi:MAG TPA: ATP-binding protein [Caldimonas sp.]|jgi:signal transduction histidine kinase/ActR/RegA family two-component response regulator|nr:ATP-binding protein [Caldimonas sp.]HEX2541060.1 ATP-binding protein [Caldimonas sp.]
MAVDREEDDGLRATALRNGGAILAARERADEELLRAKQALEARTLELGHSLSLMQATLEATADGILVTGSDGRIVTFNEKFLSIWRLERSQVEGAFHRDLVSRVAHHFRDPADLGGRIARLYETPVAEALDVLELADGRIFERFSRAQTLGGEIVGRVWSYRDVTARRRVEDAVREEALVLDLLNRTGAAIASTLDLQPLLQTVTDVATALSGASFGAFFYNTVDPSGAAFQLFTLSGAAREQFERFGHPRATPIFAPTFAGEAPVRIDDVLADPRYGRWAPHHGMPEGHLPVRSYLAVPVKLRSGETIGALLFGHPDPGVFTERSERLVAGIASQASIAVDNARLYEETKRMLAERESWVEAERAARADIARVSRLKDEFLSTLSHELRTPLTAMLGWAKVLLLKSNEPATLERGLQAISRNAAAQGKLIEDLLDMSRIISGKVRLDVQPTGLAPIVEIAVEAVRPSADAKQVRITTSLDPAAGTVSGDPARLQQVLWNLLSNAVKFTPRDGRVEVVLRRVEAQLELSVSDSGIGIAPDFLPNVFDRFRQADSSATRKHSGLGLGLSIVKQLVELHGGTVTATSDGIDRGATFTVCLPVAALHRRPERTQPAMRSLAAAALPALELAGLKMLVVDDEPDARELIAHLLRERGVEVHEASSAGEALLSVQRLRPDLLLSDIGMPERDGYALIADVRRLAPSGGGETPAIALTAFARREDRARALASGYQVHMPKPVEPGELLAAVARLSGRDRTPGSA